VRSRDRARIRDDTKRGEIGTSIRRGRNRRRGGVEEIGERRRYEKSEAEHRIMLLNITVKLRFPDRPTPRRCRSICHRWPRELHPSHPQRLSLEIFGQRFPMPRRTDEYVRATIDVAQKQ